LKSTLKPSRFIELVNCAIEGILWAVNSQRHMRAHFLAAAAVLLLALFYRVAALDFVALAFAVTLVLVVELVNTALEVVVDLVSPDFHPLARRAKDVAAGSVLVASIGAVMAGYVVLAPYVFPDTVALRSAPSPGALPVFSALVVTILVVLAKGCLGKGTPLHGGMPSGHAAVAFSIATSFVLAPVGPMLSILAVAMAVMVSQSRLLLGIHALREVLVGALLGTGVTLLLYLFLA
jgi:diacylglycerol kinase (ATP)